MKKYLKCLVIIHLWILSACVSSPKLSYVSPVAIDLSGDWIWDQDLSQTVVMVPPRLSKEKKIVHRAEAKASAQKVEIANVSPITKIADEIFQVNSVNDRH
ncbi:MAG: hypothetical protein ACI9FR_000763 [Cryomorphaceae bacterium]|jgi:hypothetical protein